MGKDQVPYYLAIDIPNDWESVKYDDTQIV
jgi:hypothetical protein